jgi:hypothetical protein
MTNTPTKPLKKWTRVSRRVKCPACGSSSWCSISPEGDLVHCLRVKSNRPAKNSMGGWLHVPSEAIDLPRERPVRKIPQANIDLTEYAETSFLRGAQTRQRLAVELGVTVESLERLTVGYAWDEYRKLECSTWPERDPTGKVVGITRRYWKQIAGGNKRGMQGGKHGLFIPKGWRSEAGPILLPEGGSDTAAIIGLGITAIGRPSNTAGAEMLRKLLDGAGRKIIVIGERDMKPEKRGTVEQCPASCEGCLLCWPGRAGSRAMAQRLRAVSRLPPPGFKDAREWIHSEITAEQFFAGLT